MAASHKGHNEVVRLLLGAGAETNLAAADGYTALMAASYEGHNEVVRLLLDAGAETNLAATDGLQCLDTSFSQKATMRLFGYCWMPVPIRILAATDGYTALMAASCEGHNEVVRLLLDAGAETNLAATDGYNALILASRKGHNEVVRLLLDAGADKNLAATDGYTALMAASHNGHIEVVRVLLAAGCRSRNELSGS